MAFRSSGVDPRERIKTIYDTDRDGYKRLTDNLHTAGSQKIPVKMAPTLMEAWCMA